MAELDEKKALAAKEEKAKKPAKDKVSFGEKLGHFFRSYKSELKKIVWSPWRQVRKNSLVVFAVVIACAALICVLDIVFTRAIFWLGTAI